MQTVAEGVETVAQIDVLREMGCDQLQGYLMSTPVPRDAFASVLKHRNGHMLLPAERASGIDQYVPKR
jgi:EAL domain-containing protein (putative c-di-GMP-specific phosphodiesterase class I)